MKCFAWSPRKNEWLRQARGVTFEQVVACIEQGDLLDVLEHPDGRRYSGTRIAR